MEKPVLIKSLDEKDFNYFKEVVYKESGIKLTEHKKALVQSRLIKRMRTLNLSEYREYATYLDTHYNSEIETFINAITTNKTDFFREDQHFDFMQNTAFPKFKNKHEKEIRIWSAGCSTGEEPYTLAISSLEYLKLTRAFDVKILATDIDTNVLAKAQEGVYNRESIEVMNKNIQSQYFLKGKGDNEGSYKVKEILKNLVTFKRLNLLDPVFPMRKKFHLIFCRNVIIYFDKETQKTLFSKIYNLLDDDGYLFIGHSENLSVISDKFKLLGKTIYEKIPESK